MKYKIKQKIFSLASKFRIKNEFDEDMYIVEGKVLSIGKKLRLYDLNQNELVYIEQQLFKLLPLYKIYINGELKASIKKKFTLFKPEFEIISDYGNYMIKGNFINHEYQIFLNGKVVATISKGWFTLSDTYGVEVSDDENQPFMLSLVIVLDQVSHEGNN